MNGTNTSNAGVRIPPYTEGCSPTTREYGKRNISIRYDLRELHGPFYTLCIAGVDEHHVEIETDSYAERGFPTFSTPCHNAEKTRVGIETP